MVAGFSLLALPGRQGLESDSFMNSMVVTAAIAGFKQPLPIHENDASQVNTSLVQKVGVTSLQSLDSVASGFHFHWNLLILSIKKNALKQQCPFAPSIVTCASHCSVGPPEETDKVFSGAEGENNIFSL